MATRNTNGNHHSPPPLSTSSSVTLVTPILRDRVGDIASKLAEVDDLVDHLKYESAVANHVPDKNDLLDEISKLGEEVNKVKLDQASKINAIRDDIKKNTKNQVFESGKGRLDTLISDTIAVEVKKQVEEWGNRPTVGKFIWEFRSTLDENNALLGEAGINLENSVSRHANSTLSIHEDLGIKLKPIKRQDGSMSELFPNNLGEFFSYGAAQIAQLMTEYDLQPLEKYSENLTRFLLFIGINETIPDQFVNFPEEPLPAYNNATGESEDRRNRRNSRQGSSSSQGGGQNGMSLWPSWR